MEAVGAAHVGRRENLSLRRSAPRRGGRAKQTFDAAFESFYSEHVAAVYQYALAVLANPADAEDVTQQTFLNAYRAFQKGERPHTPHNWLIKIAHNVCRMRWRQSTRRPHEIPIENTPEPAAPDDDKPSLDLLLAELGRLPFNQRAAIVMREVEDRSYADIADVLETTVPAVEALLFRARATLRSRRKALAGALSVAPIPASLSSFFGGGGMVAAGGAFLGSEIALKVAAMVTAGVVAGGIGFKAVNAVATSDPQPVRAAYEHAKAAPSPAASGRATQAAQAGRAKLPGFAHPRRKSSSGGALRRAPQPVAPSAAAGAQPASPAASSAASPAVAAAQAPVTPVAAAVAKPAAQTVGKVVSSVPLPVPQLPPAPALLPPLPSPSISLPAPAPQVPLPAVVPQVGLPAPPAGLPLLHKK